ncbi:5-fold beta-flower protein [Clostridium oryzae]|uniref:Uncharacterized protein n=1 Tax=Clostridium oryzae TaxID=1450648 RepID=A0A1V4IIC2_9CLOT|nr:hypothetical protein [Clostridium oryzae]OPJ59435.1 hypothetical protein CLORY_32770 [Clostridium oryzae]
MEKIYDNHESVVGYTENGVVFDSYNNIIGYVDDPVLMDCYGNPLGFVSNSVIYSVDGYPIAYFDGWNIRSVATGKRLGRVNSSWWGLLAAGLLLGWAFSGSGYGYGPSAGINVGAYGYIW